MLRVNPDDRPSLEEIISELESIADGRGVNLKEPALVCEIILVHELIYFVIFDSVN